MDAKKTSIKGQGRMRTLSTSSVESGASERSKPTEASKLFSEYSTKIAKGQVKETRIANARTRTR